jgi:hypothetical protein
MASQVLEIKVGDVEVLVDTVVIAGTQPTASRFNKVGQQTSDAYARAQDVILGVAVSTAELIGKCAARGARPDKAEVEFGLSFSTSGNVVMVGVTAQATFRVLLSYERKGAAPAPTGPTELGNHRD